jgi:glycosyltransferase
VGSQTFKDIEHIIVDGASSDNTIELVKDFPHVAKIISEPDDGIYEAMNKGIGLATGDVIGILNSDDVFVSPQILTLISDCFLQNPGIKALYGDISYFKTGNMERVVRYWKSKNYYPGFFEDGNMPPHPSLFVKKEVYQTIGTYKTHYKISADQEFLIRMLKVHAYPSFYLNIPVVRMRIGGRSTNGLKSYLFNTKEIIRTWQDNGLKYPFRLLFIRPVKKMQQLIFRR